MTTETPDVSPPTFPTNESSSTCGRVKWFNNKAGYGFITVSSGDNAGSDVFVHHSAIQVEHEQYRYLVQGEYVNFELCSVDDENNHKWQAGVVKGMDGGKLMCETRLESRELRATRTQAPDGEPSRRPNRQNGPNVSYRDDGPNHYRVRSKGSGPRDGDEWMLVRRRAPRSATSPKSSHPDVLRGRPPTKSSNGGGSS